MKTLRVALAGNPNAGKSTIFNALTGARQHVGNWPGKTVEKKEGKFRYGDYEIELVDLPGTYSLTAYSPEEMIARDYIINEKPDLVVTVVDAANLERNLYLAVQVLELEVPIIMALNMSDVADARGLKIDQAGLGAGLNAPVVRTAASKGDGLDALRDQIVSFAGKQQTAAPFRIDYGSEIERELNQLETTIHQHQHIAEQFPVRWLAVKLLEGDDDIQTRLRVVEGGMEVLVQVNNSADKLEKEFDDDVDVIVADERYGWINALVRKTVDRSRVNRLTRSDQVDRIVTHRLFGIPIFFLAMWAVFKLTADVSAPYLDWVDGVISGPISNWVIGLLSLVGLGGSWVESLFVDGIIAGVGGVMVFVPVMMFLYLALALLEDSGYMARAAFVMDRLMHALGLHGKSFLPMLVGFGCTVPAMYATRTLENEKDRILTGLLVPFMSCGARLPVYVLFAAIFFPQNAGLVVFSMYFLGILTAIVLGIILKNSLFKGKEESTFVMELPPYRLPSLRSIWFHMWERTYSFMRKAWTIIMATSIVIWFLLAIPVRGGASFADTDVSNSAFATVNEWVTPALAPLGFNSWQASSALMTGFLAKEVVVSTMSQVYAVAGAEEVAAPTTFFEDLGEIVTSFVSATGDTIKSLPLIVGIDLLDEEAEEEPTALMHAVRAGFDESSNGHGALAALAFMVFVLIYTPCMTAVAAEKQELGAKWMWVSIIGQLTLAWLMAFAVYQGGLLLGLG